MALYHSYVSRARASTRVTLGSTVPTVTPLAIDAIRREQFPLTEKWTCLNHAACSVRHDRLRIAPHSYNTSENVVRFLSCLPPESSL
jgi:hypothetical protein